MKTKTKTSLILRASLMYFLSFFYVALLIFVPAGSLKFWNGWLFMGALFIPVLLVIRIKNEEKVLLNGLKGYEQYMKKVKYRLLPFIW